ncbi:MAG: chemotaxis protein CheW [Sulfurimonas sp.]|nr:chemotaxis protein CheW [Sulfurimonas sp.]
MQIQEILIVQNDHENYGISTEYINQISRVPDLMPLPLRPSGVRGLCSVGGNVVAMVDMNLLLGFKEVDINEHKSRVVSLNGELSSNTLLVSDVYNTVEIEQENIDYLENRDDPVIAIYKYKDLLVQVLSLEELFLKINRVNIPAKEVVTGKVKEKSIAEEDSTRFLIFSMSRERYALEIDYLQEIILADQDFTEVAGSSSELIGLITLREELLMVIDLRTYYGFKSTKSDENRILVISYDGKKIGLYIDSIIDIKNFYARNIEYMSDTFEGNKIAGVIHDEESLVSFFNEKLILEIFKENDAFVESTIKNSAVDESDEYAMEVIVFKLGQKEYAFDIEYVDEIMDMVASTEVAFTESYIDGIINIRGQIVTTISLFDKLNLEAITNEDSKIIVCKISDNRIGFVVDSVSDILTVKQEDIREEHDGYFNNILHLNDGERLVLSMDIDKIVSKERVS